MTNDHFCSISTLKDSTPPTFYAKCLTCHWAGPHRAEFAHAMDDVDDHIEDMMRVASPAAPDES